MTVETYESADPKPDLTTRQRDGGPLWVKCPVCGGWELPFAVTKLSSAAATLAGADWACGGCISKWDREQSGDWAAHDFASLTDA